MVELVPETVFVGTLHTKTSVNARGEDGLLHHGNLIGKEKDDFIVDFDCGQEGVKLVPIGQIYKNYISITETFQVGFLGNFTKNCLVEVLLRLQRNEPWKWYSATLLDGDFVSGSHGLVRASSPGRLPMVLVVAGQQIRIPPDYTSLKRSQVGQHELGTYNVIPHRLMPWEPILNVNKVIPCDLLREVFDCLNSMQSTQVRQVCPLWNEIITAGARVVRLDWSGMFGDKSWSKLSVFSGYLSRLWNHSTRIVVLIGLRAQFGFLLIMMKQIANNYGYRPLQALVITGENNFAPSFVSLHEFDSIVGMMDIHLRTVCNNVLFHNTVLKVGLGLSGQRSFGEFGIPIREGRIEILRDNLRSKLLSVVDENYIANLKARFRCKFADVHWCEWSRLYILSILNQIQPLDPSGALKYQDKEWRAEDLITLDVDNLTRLTLLMAAPCLYRYGYLP